MGLDIENDAGILKHYNVTNVEKSPCLIENTTSNSKIIIFQNKIAIITFCEMLDGEFAEWIEVMRYRHSYKTHMYIISNKMRLENNEFVRYCSTLTRACLKNILSCSF
jgi:tetrahydrodipicolinate N-succinyltransferase